MIHEIIANLNHIFQTMGVQGLFINAGIESCLPGFPLPPDVLLSVMNLAKPDKAMFYALICTIGSVLGGSFGFCLGRFGGRPVCDFLFKKNPEKLKTVENMYQKYGSFAVFVSAFTPIPYNILIRTAASSLDDYNLLTDEISSYTDQSYKEMVTNSIWLDKSLSYNQNCINELANKMKDNVSELGAEVKN